MNFDKSMNVYAWLLLVVGVVGISNWLRRRRLSLAKVPGPPSRSFLYGNLPELLQSLVGEVDLKWQAQYGDVYRVTGTFNQDVLVLSDPKAIQYAFQNFIKPHERRNLGLYISGPSVIWQEGENHKRHRKIMEIGLDTANLKKMVPHVVAISQKLISKLNDLLDASSSQSTIINLPDWSSSATLDIIGRVGFDHDFGCLDSAQSALAQEYITLFVQTFRSPTNNAVLMYSLLGQLPPWLSSWISRRFLLPERLLNHSVSMNKFSKDILGKIVADGSDGQSRYDIMSRIVAANEASEPSKKLNEEELIATIRTLLVAGHETSAKSVAWIIFELCKYQDIQNKVREEIRRMERMVSERGNDGYTWHDLENMPYTLAVIKEGLRFHPVAFHMPRDVHKDTVLPLSKPIISADGQEIRALPVPKGTRIMASAVAYNNLVDVFGDNPLKFDPDRWLGTAQRVKSAVSAVGPFANLMTFGTGYHSCAGYKLSIMETQVLLIELVKTFQFSLAVSPDRVRREACNVMVPMIEGEEEKGCQLPVYISPAPQED